MKNTSTLIFNLKLSIFRSSLLRSAGFAVIATIMCLLHTDKIAAEEPSSKGSTEENISAHSKETDSPFTEILVNGANIESPLKEVPSSASVITEKELEYTAVEHLDDLIESVPNLLMASGTNRGRFFQIRGIGEREQFEGSPNSSVGLAIDDVNLSGVGGVASLFDIEQVEVLRGPQGMRFGANALAGFINIRSNEPTLEFSNNALFKVGTYGLWETNAASSGPVTENKELLFRVSAGWHESDGFIRNKYLSKDTNRRQELSLRGKLVWEPSNQTKVTLNTLHFDYNNGYDAFSIFNGYETYSDEPGEDDQITSGASLVIEQALSEAIDLKLVTSTARSNIDYRYDGDWGNDQFWGEYAPYDYFASTDRTRRTISQEIRIASSSDGYIHGETDRWFTGVYGEKLSEVGTTEQLASSEIYDTLDSDFSLETIAGFAQYEFALGDRWSLSSGIRAEQANTSYFDNRGNSGGPDNLMFGGNLTLAKDLTEETRWYSTISRGYKGGGVNVSIGVPEDKAKYEAEYLWNFESGIKSRSASGLTEGSISAFYSLRRDQQILYTTQLDPSDPLSYIYITDNAAQGYNTGLETDFVTELFPTLTAIADLGLLYSEVTEAPVELSSLEGRQQAHAPNWQYHLGLVKDLGYGFFSRVDFSGRDRFYFDTAHDERSAVLHQLDLSVGYETNTWRITFWGRNVFDDNNEMRGFYFGNEPPNFDNKRYVQLGERANCGVSIAVKF